MPYGTYQSRGTDPTYSSAANGMNPRIPVEVTKDLIKGAVAKSAVMRMARQVRMSRHLKTLPVLNNLPATYWVNGDTGLKQTTAVDYRNAIITAEELAALVLIPDVVRKDMDGDPWSDLRPLMEEAIGKAVDEAVLFGIGKPSSWPSDIKTAAIAAGNTVTSGTGVDIAADVNNVYAAVENDGYMVSGSTFAMGMKSQFRGLRDLNNAFIFKPGNPGMENTTFGDSPNAETGDLLGANAVITRNGAFESEGALATSTTLIAGDWSQLYFAIREDMNIDFTNSGVIHDSNGLVQFNAWQQDSTIMRVIFRCGFVVPNPPNRVNETTATRYPFALLRDAA